MPQVLLINPPNSSSVLDGADPTVTRSEDLTDWANVTLYNNGNKVWGNEPPP